MQIAAADDVLPDGTKVKTGCWVTYSAYVSGRGVLPCYMELELVADLLWVLDPLLWPEPNEFRSYGYIVIMII